jgi:hypothetical protein
MSRLPPKPFIIVEIIIIEIKYNNCKNTHEPTIKTNFEKKYFVLLIPLANEFLAVPLLKSAAMKNTINGNKKKIRLSAYGAWKNGEDFPVIIRAAEKI